MNTHSHLLTELQQSFGKGQETSAPASALRAIAWARVSTDMQDERGMSLPEQLREITVYAERHNIEIVDTFSEAASAFQKEDKRIEFQRMLATARADKRVNAILVHDFSRFSRDSVRGKSLFRELKKNGIQVISVNDPDFDPETVSGVWMEAVTFAKNEAYSREVAFHTKKGCRGNVQTRDPETGWCYKNGGQPLFGYMAIQLQRGEERKGRAILKSIWVLDDTLVNGRPLHEWARECLLMAARGASLDELRDFCNTNNIPARRKDYWGTSTWNAILQPHILLKYTGQEVWNVHRKNGSERPAEEWTIVENAHPAIITAEEAKAIAAARQTRSVTRLDVHNRHQRTSRYLLSGGLFKCARCGSNMVGYHNAMGYYYLCGSQVYRRGLGCGAGIYVRQEEAEQEVIKGFRVMLAKCADPHGFTRSVNEELMQMWRDSTGFDPHAGEKLTAIDRKIANIRKAIAEGLDDITWANEQLRTLRLQREEIADNITVIGEAPQIDAREAKAYREQQERLLTEGSFTVRRNLLRECVGEVRLLADTLEGEVDYLLPAPIIKIGSGSFDSEAYRDRRGSGGGI